MEKIRRNVQVNIPFTMLWDRYADVFLSRGLNPEIGIDAAALDRFSEAEFGEMATRVRERGLRVTLHGPFSDLSPGSIDQMIRSVTRKRFEQLLEVVPLFRPISVVCHAGYECKRYGYLYEEWFRLSVEMWRWFAEEVNRRGSRLMLENVYEAGPEDLAPLFEELRPQNVGFCFDTGHQSAFSRSSLESWLGGLGPNLAQVHLHDNCGDQDQHLALGHGRIDFSILFRHLKSLFSDLPPVITLEPHTEDALAPSLEYLSAIWPW
jgi:sugar phosphate isomerase/epimerase